MSTAVTKKEERTIRPHGRDRFTYAGIFAVAIAAAVLSFSSLTGLAEMAGVTGSWSGFRLAWLLPIAVDAYAVTATRVWLAGGSHPATVRYARANAIGAIGLSVAGNATYHALAASGIDSLGHARAGWLGVVAVSAVPPVMLGLVGHLHALISNDVGSTAPADVPVPVGPGAPQPDTTGADATDHHGSPSRVSRGNHSDQAPPKRSVEAESGRVTGSSKSARSRATTSSRSRSTGKTSTGNGPSPAETVMRQHWATERAAGRTPTGAELDRIAGTKDYGRRIRRTLLAEVESGSTTATDADDEPTGVEPKSTDPEASRDAA